MKKLAAIQQIKNFMHSRHDKAPFLTPTQISLTINYSIGTIRKACRELAKSGDLNIEHGIRSYWGGTENSFGLFNKR